MSVSFFSVRNWRLGVQKREPNLRQGKERMHRPLLFFAVLILTCRRRMGGRVRPAPESNGADSGYYSSAFNSWRSASRSWRRGNRFAAETGADRDERACGAKSPNPPSRLLLPARKRISTNRKKRRLRFTRWRLTTHRCRFGVSEK